MTALKQSLKTLARFHGAALALVFATACADGGDARGPAAGQQPGFGSETGEQSGSLTIELNPGDDVTFTSFSYAIVRPGFAKSGNIDVSHSKTVSATIAGLPPATGYSLTLMGQSAAPVDANCSGSALFDVTAGQVTQVPIGIACHVTEVEPPAPAPAPIPPLAPLALGVLLAAAGAARLGRRRTNA